MGFDMCWSRLEVEVGMALVGLEMMQLVKVGSVVVVILDEVFDEIEGFDTLLDNLGI